MKEKKLAVLLTCFNRQEKTLNCLKGLEKQVCLDSVVLSIYVVDDGSTDGTAEAIRNNFPKVHVIKGDGSLFWNGGMRLAFDVASKQGYDYYLWLNDDTLLYPNAISNLLKTAVELEEKLDSRIVVVGSTQDPTTLELTYGGIKKGKWWQPLKFSVVQPGDEAISCDTMNGNCVLLPRQVTEIVGNLDPGFDHDLGDYDYGLRARRHQCTLWIMPGYVGTCSANPHSSRVDKSINSTEQVISKLNHPKGLAFKDVTLHPLMEWKIFSRRHGGLLWPIFWLLPYRRLLPRFIKARL
jgi:GT2 family glycosyltransferase